MMQKGKRRAIAATGLTCILVLVGIQLWDMITFELPKVERDAAAGTPVIIKPPPVPDDLVDTIVNTGIFGYVIILLAPFVWYYGYRARLCSDEKWRYSRYLLFAFLPLLIGLVCIPFTMEWIFQSHWHTLENFKTDFPIIFRGLIVMPMWMGLVVSGYGALLGWLAYAKQKKIRAD